MVFTEFFAVDNPRLELFDQGDFMREVLSLYEIMFVKELKSRSSIVENFMAKSDGQAVDLAIHVHNNLLD